jgi:hypothetical protein
MLPAGKPAPFICRKSGKMRYDKRGAESQRNRLHDQGRDGLRIYPCKHCGGWHLAHLKS